MKIKWPVVLTLLFSILPSYVCAEHRGYIVKFRTGIDPLQEKSLHSEGMKIVKTSFGTYGRIEHLEKSGIDESVVEYIEPNYIYTLIRPLELGPEIGEDKASGNMFAKQWGLKNNGRNSGGLFSRGKAGEDINALKAWKTTRGNRKIIVAVIDTGIDYNHPDLKGQVWVNKAEKEGRKGFDDDGNGYIDDIYGHDFGNNDGDPMDGHGHGTHCAGVIGAAHDGKGMMGVMGKVQIMGIKFLSDQGRGETIDAIGAIDYAIKNKADIMSNSWGGGEKSQALKEAIARARDAGILFVAAAGNSSLDNDRNPTYPANYDVDNIISVGAMDGRGRKSGFSNYGKNTVHVFAPGSGILSTVKNGKYQKMSGTSMAAPFVAGVLGLAISGRSDADIDYLEVKNQLVQSTVDNGELTSYAQGGRVDASGLLLLQSN